MQMMEELEKTVQTSPDALPGAKAVATVPTYFHFVYTQAKNNSGAFVPQNIITKQINALNLGFKNSGMQFNLISSSHTTNTAW